jgi:hypothetical protein
MGTLNPFSKYFIIAGLILILIGIFINFGLGRLPGDIYIKKDNFTFYFPLMSCLIVSIVVTIILRLLKK